jgi:hypothetical protein
MSYILSSHITGTEPDSNPLTRKKCICKGEGLHVCVLLHRAYTYTLDSLSTVFLLICSLFPLLRASLLLLLDSSFLRPLGFFFFVPFIPSSLRFLPSSSPLFLFLCPLDSFFPTVPPFFVLFFSLSLFP